MRFSLSDAQVQDCTIFKFVKIQKKNPEERGFLAACYDTFLSLSDLVVGENEDKGKTPVQSAVRS